MGFISEIKDCFRFFSKKNEAARKLVFYSESSAYYLYFEDYINSILENSDISFSYITSDKNDLIFNQMNDRIKVFYFKKLLPFIFPFINARVMVMTMTNLNQSYIKKAKNSLTEYIYVFHAMMSTHVAYNKGAFDHYDTIFCVGPYQVDEIKKTEAVYQLKEKRLIPVGYPLLEKMHEKYATKKLTEIDRPSQETIMIAPSWFDGNIFDTVIYDVVDQLIGLNYKIVLRPHPEYLKRKIATFDSITQHYKNQPQVFIESNLNDQKNILCSELLITDWSGIAFEYAWAVEKPVLFIDTIQKIFNPEYERLNMEAIEVSIRNKIGKVLGPENLSKLPEILTQLIAERSQYHIELLEERNKNVFNWNSSAKVGADYIINALK